MTKIKRVGFVATGDEIIVGDIINTNVAYFAQQLKLNNIVPGKQMTVGDNEADIRDAILYIQQDHDCIITIGGLGPTKDDLTRNGLAEALHLPLAFYDEPWTWIVQRFAERNIPLTDNNRQQAFLPKGSVAIHNKNGSACACYLEHQGKEYFMLPGPPSESCSLFDEAVLPRLKAKHYQRSIFRKIWLLFGVSESKIADSLEKIPENGCEVGYRVNYPYLEIKLACRNADDLEKTVTEFDKILNPFSISNERISASQQLISVLEKSNQTICLDDQATGGRLQSLLLSPKTAGKINFAPSCLCCKSFPSFPRKRESILNMRRWIPAFAGMTRRCCHACDSRCHSRESGNPSSINIQIRGLAEYWKNKKADEYHLELSINNETQKLTIPVRGQNSLLYACELLAMKILPYIS